MTHYWGLFARLDCSDLVTCSTIVSEKASVCLVRHHLATERMVTAYCCHYKTLRAELAVRLSKIPRQSGPLDLTLPEQSIFPGFLPTAGIEFSTRLVLISNRLIGSFCSLTAVDYWNTGRWR